MRLTSKVTMGVALIVLGAIWLLQGFDAFPGQSFMNGRTEWVVIGAIIAGLGIFVTTTGARGNASE